MEYKRIKELKNNLIQIAIELLRENSKYFSDETEYCVEDITKKNIVVKEFENLRIRIPYFSGKFLYGEDELSTEGEEFSKKYPLWSFYADEGELIIEYKNQKEIKLRSRKKNLEFILHDLMEEQGIDEDKDDEISIEINNILEEMEIIESIIEVN